MHNVTYTTENDRLVITVALDGDAIREAPLSSTGKTRLVGPTSGSVKLSDRLSFSVNVMAKG